MRFLLAPLLFLAPLLAKEPFAAPPQALAESSVTVDLRNPIYKNGILTTTQGGVICNEDIRIQAKTVRYFRKGAVHKIEAEGELLIQYKGRVYVGASLEYDFQKKSGIIREGKTFASYWYIGGDEILLHPDGSYQVKNVFMTTCENEESTWDLHAKSVDVIKGDLLSAKNVRFRLFKIPTLWLPSFKVNLKKKFKEPIFKYDFRWDSGLGPRISTRYELYSWKDFALYGRVEYRWSTGWGGALETEYLPSDFKTRFVTKSYLATDRLLTAPNKQLRYRLQGAFTGESDDGKTSALLTWDKYSDVRMPGDFKSDDFEVNTAKKTLFYMRQREDDFVAYGKVRLRANPFESIKQDFPTGQIVLRPLELGSSKIYSSTLVRASFLDFAYSNQLTHSIAGYQSPRVEVRERLSRTFQLQSAALTPYLGGVGIFYGNSPFSHPQWLGILSYGARAEARGMRVFSDIKHQLLPYAEYTGFSSPTVSPDKHYIFSIADGYDRINQLRAGVRSLVFSKGEKEPLFSADLYALSFFADLAIPQTIPYMNLDLSWHFPSLHADWENRWNFREETLQYSNARIRWTVNENVAISLEGRYRSRFDWRKSDHENFLLDITRSQSELLLSPISDQRVTFLTNLFIRFTPFWECRIQSHHGFLRLNEPPYNEVKVDLFTWISSAVRLRVSYGYSADRGINSVSGQIYLIRK